MHTVGVASAMAIALLTGCSSGGDDATPATSAAQAGDLTTSLSTTEAPDTETPVTDGTERSTTTFTIDTTPVVRVGENDGVDTGGFNIGHGEMTADRVELSWSQPAAATAETPATYRVYRVESVGNDPTSVQLRPSDLVYEGPELSTTDVTVSANVFYTYILEVEIDQGIIDQRAWTDTLTVADTTPPTPVTDLTAEVGPAGVALRWGPSTDDVEFASYAVSVETDGELEYLGGGADPGQTNFTDDQPRSGTTTYVVQAVDFHDNRSEPVSIEVTVP